MRHEPSDRAEQVTQLLFGEHFTILESGLKWTKIQHAWDEYIGWISTKQFQTISTDLFTALNTKFPTMVGDIAQVVLHKEQNSSLPVLLGSVLPQYNNHSLSIGSAAYQYEGSLQNTTPKNLRNALIETAYLYINSPYAWGGRTPFGIDCSGFTQMVYKLCGQKILRDASQQAGQGNPLSFIEESLPGDLAFFDNEDGKIIHVGIILKDSKIMHASGQVRIDKLDHQGIYNETLKQYTHNLRVIKNCIGD